ncbi:MAG: adenylate/guanylate cyclase domain-containing protein [Bacillota bacterium]
MNRKYKNLIAACILILILAIYLLMNSMIFWDVYHLYSTKSSLIENIENLIKNIIDGEVELNSVSYITEDNDKNLYIVDNYGKTIYKADYEGRIKFSIIVKQDIERTFCSSLTVDKLGNVFLLNTVLDSDGLYVDGERIDMYSAQGDFIKEVYSISYENGNKPMRTGRIKDLKADSNYLRFCFTADKQTVDFKKIDIEKNFAETIYSLKLNENMHIHKILLAENNRIFFSTKSGQVYEANRNGQSLPLYSGSSRYNDKLSLLSHFQYFNNEIYFIDLFEPGIMKLNPSGSKTVSVFSQHSEAHDSFFSKESNSLKGLHVTQEGKIITFSERKVFVLSNDGNIEKSISSLQIPARKIKAIWVNGLVLLLIIAVLIDLLRIIYVHFMRRKLSLILKEILIFIPIVVIVTGFLIYRIDNRLSIQIESEMNKKLNIMALTAPKFINGDRLQRINSPEDCLGTDYNEAVKNIAQVFTSNEDSLNDGLYNVIYRLKNGKVYYIMDNDDGRLFYEPLSTETENYNEITEKVVHRGEQYYSEAVHDSSGVWIFVMAPIKNSAGEIVGIYETGMDYTSYKIKENIRLTENLKDIVIASAVNIMAFLIITFYVLSTIKTLRKGVDEIAAGNWNTVVEVRSNDEIASLCEGFNTMAQFIRDSISEIMKMNKAYFYFVPQQYLQLLNKDSICDIRLGDSMKRDMSIMYSCIRPFQQLLQNNTSEENFNMINSYLSSFGPFIRDNKGIVEKYLGMDILALFPRNANDGLNAAINMTRELASYNKNRTDSGQTPLEMGIGIYHGPLMVGIIGEEKRLEGTVISDHGNTSELLARLTEKMGAQIIITENTLTSLEGTSNYAYRSLGLVALPGKAERVPVYDVYESDNEVIRELKEKTKEVFEEGIELFQKGLFYESRSKFVEVIKQNDCDKAAKVYFYLSDDYYRKGLPENWDGSLSI